MSFITKNLADTGQSNKVGALSVETLLGAHAALPFDRLVFELPFKT